MLGYHQVVHICRYTGLLRLQTTNSSPWPVNQPFTQTEAGYWSVKAVVTSNSFPIGSMEPQQPAGFLNRRWLALALL